MPSRGGVFEVDLDGDLLHSKAKSGKHAEFDDVLASLRKAIVR